MSIIKCDYLPERRKVEMPPELALLMIRKAAILAAQFEERALDEMTKAAYRHLRDGQTTEQVAWQLQLEPQTAPAKRSAPAKRRR